MDWSAIFFQMTGCRRWANASLPIWPPIGKSSS